MLTNTCGAKHRGRLISQHAECKHHSAERGNSISRAESQFHSVLLKEAFAALVVNCRHHVGNIYCREMQLWAKINPESCCQHPAFRGRRCSRKWDLLPSPAAVMWRSARELSGTAADFQMKSFTARRDSWKTLKEQEWRLIQEAKRSTWTYKPELWSQDYQWNLLVW